MPINIKTITHIIGYENMTTITQFTMQFQAEKVTRTKDITESGGDMLWLEFDWS